MLKETRKRFTEKEARLILKHIVEGFKEIYSKGIMHRDLKLANILVHFPKEDLTFYDIENAEEKK